MRSKTNYYIACLSALFIFLPNSRFRIIYILILFFASLLKNRGISKTLVNVGMLRFIYCITFIASYLIHYYKASISYICYFLLVFFVARYLILRGVRSNNDVEKLIDFILIVFMFYALLGIIESLTQFNIFDKIGNRVVELYGANKFRGSFYRNHGLCDVSINNGMLVFMVWVLACYKNFKFKNRLYLLILSILTIDLFMIFSRMVLLIAVIVFVLIVRKQSVRRKMLFTISTSIVSILILFVVPNQLDMFSEVISESFAPLVDEFFRGGIRGSQGISLYGSGQRIALWGWVFEAIRNNFFWGLGFEYEFSRVYIVNGVAHLKKSVEVHWLLTVMQKGVFGLAGFIAYQLFCIKMTVLTLRKTDKKIFSLSHAYIFMTIGYFLCLFTCAGFQDLYYFYLLFSIYESFCLVNNKITDRSMREKTY